MSAPIVKRCRGRHDGRHRREAAAPIAPGLEGVSRDDVPGAIVNEVVLPEHSEAIGMEIGQRSQQHAIDQRENRDGGAGAECKRQRGRGRESRVVPEHAARVPDVGERVRERPEAAGVATVLLDALQAAEVAERGAAGLRG
jgi:hypothetical protein